jgi:hypothetical protein
MLVLRYYSLSCGHIPVFWPAMVDDVLWIGTRSIQGKKRESQTGYPVTRPVWRYFSKKLRSPASRVTYPTSSCFPEIGVGPSSMP